MIWGGASSSFGAPFLRRPQLLLWVYDLSRLIGAEYVQKDHLPLVTIELDNDATMRAELYPGLAPNTVNSFSSLISKGFYDGLTFGRVIPGFMIQGGCPKGIGIGGPGCTIAGEFR
jgi:peptidyl-prolyl cis-trans isomerase B (cyclophilin B)